MNQKRFLILIAVAAIVSIAAWLASQKQASRYGLEETALFLPDLDGQLDQLSELKIQPGGGSAFHLDNKEGQWRVRERENFPADTTTLRTELRKLASTKALEAKTKIASNYARLGVQDIDLADPDTLQLTAMAGEVTVLDLIVGKSGQSGTYVRTAGETQSWLIDERLSWPKTPAAWLDKSLVDIARDRLARIEINPAEGASYSLSKDSPEQADFTLRPAPAEDHTLNHANLNRLGAALSRLRLEDVVPAPEQELAWDVARFTRFDGLQIEARTALSGDDRLLQLSAKLVESTQAEPAEEDSEAETNSAPDPAGLAAELEQMQNLVTGRTFKASNYSVDAMRIAYEHMQKPPVAESNN